MIENFKLSVLDFRDVKVSKEIQAKNWNRSYSRGLTTLQNLSQLNWIQEGDIPQLEKVKDAFDVRVPEAFFAGIHANDASLSRQVIPSLEELSILPEELEDPIGDEPFSPMPGLTHRYPDRVLLKPTYLCGMYCRFCFRRYKVSDHQQNLSRDQLQRALEYIASQKQIWEVILTGGDPLVFSDEKLKFLLIQLNQISHLKIVRFHTRMLTAVPDRVSDSFLEVLKMSRQRIWMAIHVNSVSELTEATVLSLEKLVNQGVQVISQTVLLKGVNDSVEALSSLFRRLVELGVKPYYLHYPDLARGTHHFRIPLEEAIQLVKSLRGKISGLCIPQLIVDIPGGHGKVTLDPAFATQVDAQTWVFESPTSGNKIEVRYPSS